MSRQLPKNINSAIEKFTSNILEEVLDSLISVMFWRKRRKYESVVHTKDNMNRNQNREIFLKDIFNNEVTKVFINIVLLYFSQTHVAIVNDEERSDTTGDECFTSAKSSQIKPADLKQLDSELNINYEPNSQVYEQLTNTLEKSDIVFSNISGPVQPTTSNSGLMSLFGWISTTSVSF
jgi:hypothetical protein